MTDSEKLDLILSKLDLLESETQKSNQRTTSIELHLENSTDKNIQLIAENFIGLTKKLNQAIPIADKNLAYKVKVNYLAEKIQTHHSPNHASSTSLAIYCALLPAFSLPSLITHIATSGLSYGAKPTNHE